jgi:uncharacterized protein (DUF927 family)
VFRKIIFAKVLTIMTHFNFTEASSITNKRWSRPKQLTLLEFVNILSRHTPSPSKDGNCFIPGSLVAETRSASDVKQVDALIYDIDGLQSLSEAQANLEKVKTYSLIYTSYNHRTTASEVTGKKYKAWSGSDANAVPTDEEIRRYLDENGRGHYQAVKSLGAEHVKGGTVYKFSHDPVDKFRVVIPLAKPIVLLDLSHSTPEAIDAYKGIYHGVGQALGLKYDNACSDPSRAFYLPACSQSNLDKCSVVSINTDYAFNEELKAMEFVGEPVLLDFSDYPRKKITPEAKRTAGTKGKSGSSNTVVTDATGATIDLKAWSRDYPAFDMESLLRDVLPDEDIREDRSGKEGFHIACPFEDGHTTAGGSGTYVVNGDPNETDTANSHWNIYCTHDSCKTRAGENSQRLIHLGRLLEDGIVTSENLFTAEQDHLAYAEPGIATFFAVMNANLPGVEMCGSTHQLNTLKPKKVKGREEWHPHLAASPFHYLGKGSNGLSGDKANQVHMLNVECQITKKWNKVLIHVAEIGNMMELYTKLRKLGMTVTGPALVNLLAVIQSPKTFKAVEATGWHEVGNNGQRVFVLPDHTVITKTGSEATSAAVQPVFDADRRFATTGTLEGSRALLEAVSDEPDMITMVAHALMAPLVKDFRLTEAGYLHYWGPTSIGKTSALHLALSMAGDGNKDTGITESYTGTAHATEIKAARMLDMPFGVDEMKGATGENCERLSYTLSNGRTKAAGAGFGDKLKEEKIFRCVVLSSGEMTMKDKVESAGLQYDGGASVRVTDIRFRGFLGSYPQRGFKDSQAHADFVNDMAGTHYGHVFPLSIQTYLDCDTARVEIEELRRGINEEHPQANPQNARVFSRFSLVAAYAEWLIGKGVLPWTKDKAQQAVVAVFDRWKEAQGDSSLPYEVRKALEAYNAKSFALDNQLENRTAGSTSPAFRDRLGIKYGNQVWHDDKGLETLLGDSKLKLPLLEYLQLGTDPTWSLLIHEKGRLKAKTPTVWTDKPLGSRAYCLVRRDVPEETVQDSPETQAMRLQLISVTAERDRRKSEAEASATKIRELEALIEAATANSARRHFHNGDLGSVGAGCRVRPLKGGTAKSWMRARKGNPTFAEYESRLKH